MGPQRNENDDRVVSTSILLGKGKLNSFNDQHYRVKCGSKLNLFAHDPKNLQTFIKMNKAKKDCLLTLRTS